MYDGSGLFVQLVMVLNLGEEDFVRVVVDVFECGDDCLVLQ